MNRENQENDKSPEPPPSKPSDLDRLEQKARIIALLAIPIVLALGGWLIQNSVSRRAVGSEYVKIALDIINAKEDAPPELRQWAVDLLKENSPTKLHPDLIAYLEDNQNPLTSFSSASSLPSDPPIVFIDYTVQEGDTFTSIEKHYPTTLELLESYGVIDTGSLVAGTVLRLPVVNPAACSIGRPYIIKPGDTLTTIAKQYDTTAQTLSALNNLDEEFSLNNTLFLCVPSTE